MPKPPFTVTSVLTPSLTAPGVIGLIAGDFIARQPRGRQPEFKAFATASRSIADGTAILSRLGIDKRVPVNKIRSTQSGLRLDATQLAEMRAWYETNGKKFSEPVDLEYFSEDGRILVRNGHHRLAIWQSEGVDELVNAGDRSDFRIKVSSYADYGRTHFVFDLVGNLDPVSSWLTPFDPRTHVRTPDFRAFKLFIKLLVDNGVPLEEVDRFIREHGELYLAPIPAEGVVLTPHTTPVSTRDFADYLLRMVRSMGPKIAQLIPLIPANGVVFDIGSGSGDQSYAYAKMFSRSFVVGIDVAPQSIEHARERFAAANLIFLLGDALKGFAPRESGNAVIDSSIVHELFSFTGYSRENVAAYFKQVAAVLLPGGNYASRDFTSPFWPDKVRIKLPTASESGDGPYGKYSRAELFEVYARELKTKDFPDGVTYDEIPSSELGWREFELNGIAAANFILRMEYRRNWTAELKEQYLYWNLDERVAALETAGLRVDYAAEVDNAWIYLNWWKDRLSVSDAQGRPIDLPPTNMILFAVKPGPKDPRSLEIVAVETRPGSDAFPLISYEHKASGMVWDTVHVEGETQQFIPYATDAEGNPFVYVPRRTEKPALLRYAAQSETFRIRYGGYVSEGLSMLTADDAQSGVEASFTTLWHEAGGTDVIGMTNGGAFLPTPGISDERVTTRYVAVDPARESGIDDGKFQRMELKQLIGAGNVGSVPDGRLETAAYALALKTGTKLLPWFNGVLPATDQDASSLSLSPHYPAPHGPDAFVPTESHAGFGETVTLKLKRTEHDGAASEFTREYLEPARRSLDTFSVIPYVRSGGKILVGLESRDLPTFQARGLPSHVAVIPAWRLPRGLGSKGDATRWLKDKMIGDFDIFTRHVTPLGEGYFPSADTTPEKVTPFAVELDANRAPRDLTFVPLDELIGDIESIPDLHTRIAVFRLAHATGLLATA
jgi:hypothetical protein